MRILVIEDNPSVAGALATMLSHRKYAVDVAEDGEEGLDRLLRDIYDAAIVDVVLPRSDGFTVVQSARSRGLQTPVMMLTARDAVEDRVRGLDAGADDYLVKPFDEGELLARVRALTRRNERPLTAVLKAGSLEIDAAARRVTCDGKPLELRSTEFRMLEYFMRNSGIALTRDQLLAHLWDYEFEGSSNIVDVYVSALRRKLKAAAASTAIETVWGVGYKLRA